MKLSIKSKRMIILALMGVVVLSLLGYFDATRELSIDELEQRLNREISYQESLEEYDEKSYGEASYYGSKFHGKTTASGEPYDSTLLTAAHRHYQFGTILRVINASDGSTVLVRVNDRGPFKKGRIVDVSQAAARELGIIEKGIEKVIVKRISNAEDMKYMVY